VTAQRTFVAVVDDDESIRHSLPDLLRLMGFEADAFDSARTFLESDALARADCLILDIAMPGMSGPELMNQPAVKARGVPIIFITALLDDATRRKLLDQGAVECLFKPFSEEALLDALERALGRA
jgi:FixJ family two-component response regulator